MRASLMEGVVLGKSEVKLLANVEGIWYNIRHNQEADQAMSGTFYRQHQLPARASLD